MDFNTKLSNVVDNCIDLGYEEFGRYMKDVVKDVVLEEVDATKGWFEYNRDFLMPILKERNKLLHKLKICDEEDEYLKQKCRDARSNVKNTINVAKGKWIEHLVDDIVDINMNLRRAWENIKKLAKRFTGHMCRQIS